MTPIFDRFLYGGDWNPEQWDEQTWRRDIEMLKDAHINEATINVFSWASLQPDEETYDFTTLSAKRTWIEILGPSPRRQSVAGGESSCRCIE